MIRSICISYICLLFGLTGVAFAQQVKKPNILVFLVDDMGWQDTSVPFYYDKAGQEVKTPLNAFYKTPNMEKLATAGMKFTNAYAAPVCSPSRTSLMLGKTPMTHRVSTWTAVDKPKLNDEKQLAGMMGAEWNEGGMATQEIPLPSLLKKAGYRTISVGKAHFAPNSEPKSDPRKLGFDISIAGNGLGGPGSYRADQNFVKGNPQHQVPGMDKYFLKGKDATQQQLQQHFLTSALTTEMAMQLEASVKAKAPFFAYMTHYAVHSTHEDSDPNADKNRYSATLPALNPGTQQNANTLANYATLVEGMDLSLGILVTKLEQLGVAEETLIIFISDNGGDAPIQQNYAGNIGFIDKVGAVAPLRARKGSRYEGGTRVPMIVSWAKHNPSNPTQRAYPIAPHSVNHHIVAIWDIFPTIAHLAQAKYTHKIDGHSLLPLLTGTGKNTRPNAIVQHFPHSHTYGHFYSTLRQDEWKIIYSYYDDYVHKKQPWQLFNLQDDPSESCNLAQDPAHHARLCAMAKDLISALGIAKAQFPRLIQGQDRNKISGVATIRPPEAKK